MRINGELVTEFVPLEAMLDDHVGEEIEIELERGGRRIDATVRVDDLHAITPDEYIEFGDAIVNNLSYQQARHYNRRPKVSTSRIPATCCRARRFRAAP